MRCTTCAGRRENILKVAGSAWPAILLLAVLLFASCVKACAQTCMRRHPGAAWSSAGLYSFSAPHRGVSSAALLPHCVNRVLLILVAVVIQQLCVRHEDLM